MLSSLNIQFILWHYSCISTFLMEILEIMLFWYFNTLDKKTLDKFTVTQPNISGCYKEDFSKSEKLKYWGGHHIEMVIILGCYKPGRFWVINKRQNLLDRIYSRKLILGLLLKHIWWSTDVPFVSLKSMLAPASIRTRATTKSLLKIASRRGVRPLEDCTSSMAPVKKKLY